MSITRLVNTLESGEVERYHAAPGIPKQTDGLHAWGVAVIADYILGQCPDDCVLALRKYRIMREALLHDSGELVTGDIPFTAKRYDPSLGERLKEFEASAREDHMLVGSPLNSADEAVLKIADTLDGFIWCVKWETGRGVPGFHRGKVRDRWEMAYAHAKQKFGALLDAAEWDRADEIFTKFGGTIYLP